MKGVIMFPS